MDRGERREESGERREERTCSGMSADSTAGPSKVASRLTGTKSEVIRAIFCPGSALNRNPR